MLLDIIGFKIVLLKTYFHSLDLRYYKRTPNGARNSKVVRTIDWCY